MSTTQQDFCNKAAASNPGVEKMVKETKEWDEANLNEKQKAFFKIVTEKFGIMCLPGDTSLTPMKRDTDFDLITRAKANELFEMNWCIKCGKVNKFDVVPTHLPGIMAGNCPECQSHYHATVLESSEVQTYILKVSSYR